MRADLKIISSWIKPDSSVLDLGCGNGELLKYLREKRNVFGVGLEIDDRHLVQCIKNGVNVIQIDLDDGLLGYFDRCQFNYVVMTQTLQALPRPASLLEEMVRIGDESIVTFPNMGYWKNRLQILLRGKMPVTEALPDSWFETKNIHLCSLKDFEDLCDNQHIKILERETMDSIHRNRHGMAFLPNLMGEIALYRISKA